MKSLIALLMLFCISARAETPALVGYVVAQDGENLVVHWTIPVEQLPYPAEILKIRPWNRSAFTTTIIDVFTDGLRIDRTEPFRLPAKIFLHDPAVLRQ